MLRQGVRFELSNGYGASLNDSIRLNGSGATSVYSLHGLSHLYGNVLSNNAVRRCRYLRVYVQVLPLRSPMGLTRFFRGILFVVGASYYVTRGCIYVSYFNYDRHVVSGEYEVYSHLSTSSLRAYAIHPLDGLLSYYYTRDVNYYGSGLLTLIFWFSYGLSC